MSEPIQAAERSGLYLTNTLTREKEPFAPRSGDRRVKIFTCGPSIYSRPHIGNYRTFLYEDLLVRHLEYLGYDVERVINFTDVEDKSVAEAEKKGVSNAELTEPNAKRFRDECDTLRIALPENIPRSSTSVDQAVHLIQRLIEKGVAYWHEGDVFYDPLKFPEFGKLYGLDMSRWPEKKVRFRKDTYSGHRWNLGDFILWHGHKGGDSIYWETKIGKGRPSWNIQDPAMITKTLGYEIDIACGGIDNIYRHHDYNIAVIEAISEKPFATYWLHGEHVLVDGKKMSKSKNNETFLEELLEKCGSPAHARFFLMYRHYRRRLNLSEKNLSERLDRFDAFRRMAGEIEAASGGAGNGGARPIIARLVEGFTGHMNDDLDVAGAFDAMHGALADLVALKHEGRLGREDAQAAMAAIRKIDGVLRILS